MTARNFVVRTGLVILTTALMGSSFAIGKIGLTYVSPLLLTGLRFVLAGSLMAGAVIALAGALSWTAATLLIHRWRERFDVWVLTAYQMLSGGVMLLGASAVLEKPRFIGNATSLFVLLWLAVMGSAVQFAGWFWLLRHGDPTKVSAFLFLALFFGVLFGWLLLGESVAGQEMWGGLLIFLGIYLVNRIPARRRSAK